MVESANRNECSLPKRCNEFRKIGLFFTISFHLPYRSERLSTPTLDFVQNIVWFTHKHLVSLRVRMMTKVSCNIRIRLKWNVANTLGYRLCSSWSSLPATFFSVRSCEPIKCVLWTARQHNSNSLMLEPTHSANWAMAAKRTFWLVSTKSRKGNMEKLSWDKGKRRWRGWIKKSRENGVQPDGWYVILWSYTS